MKLSIYLIFCVASAITVVYPLSTCGQPTPLIDIRIKNGDLTLEDGTFTQVIWIEIRTIDGSNPIPVQHQNSIIIQDLYFRTLVKSVTMTDWIVSETDYLIASRYTPMEGVLEWAIVHYPFKAYQKIGTPDTHKWTELAKVEIEFKSPENRTAYTDIDWYEHTPHYNFVVLNPDQQRTVSIQGRELGCVTIDPTIIKTDLLAFEATSNNGINILKWSIASETDNSGFWVERSCVPRGPFKKLNKKPVTGASHYTFADEDVEIGEEYTYRLTSIDKNGVIQRLGKITQKSMAPTAYQLGQNYPNPFNPVTTIDNRLKNDGFVKLRIFNLQGQLVHTLVLEDQRADFHSVTWDGKDNHGKPLSSGVNFYRLQVNDFVTVRKLQYLK